MRHFLGADSARHWGYKADQDTGSVVRKFTIILTISFDINE